jgi:hypothetical protein
MVGVTFVFFPTLKKIRIISQFNRSGITDVVSGKHEKKSYVIYKNSMMCAYLRSEHFVLCIDKNQIQKQATYFRQMFLLTTDLYQSI